MPISDQRSIKDQSSAHLVDPDSAEQLLDGMQLGQRIRRLRLKRSMGLVELGKLTELSASFLSQLETGRVVPTLRNLARLALVFEKDFSYFFQSATDGVFRIQRAKDRTRIGMGTPEIDYVAESFGILIPEGGLRPCMAEFMPGEAHSFQPEQYTGVEMIYVTAGTLELERNGEVHLLHERDVLYLGGQTPRVYRAHGSQPAKAMIISFDGAAPSSSSPERRPRPTAAASA